MIGTPVVLDSTVPDGVMYVIGAEAAFAGQRSHIILGTRRWNQRERTTELATRIVRNGLADVLQWLGEPVGAAVDDPIPRYTSRDILAAMRSRGGFQVPFAGARS